MESGKNTYQFLDDIAFNQFINRNLQSNIRYLLFSVNLAKQDYQNLGEVCWAVCDKQGKANSQCNYCGKKGICCRQGTQKKECDGKVGGSGKHVCTKPPNEGNTY